MLDKGLSGVFRQILYEQIALFCRVGDIGVFLNVVNDNTGHSIFFKHLRVA
jgi:hypothetical protein